MIKKKSRTRATPQLAVQTTQIRRAPLIRSAYWAWLVGGVGGAIWSASQVYLLHGGSGWLLLGALFGVPLGLVAGCDLLIPGPGPDSGFQADRGNRVGPFRWSVLAFLVALEGLLIGAYLWGDVTLVCERLAPTAGQPAQIDCRRMVTGWVNSRPIGETVYDHVIGVGLSVHNELLLQHGPYVQSQSAAGFGMAALSSLQTFLDSQTPALALTASDWRVRWGAPLCLLLGLAMGLWAVVSFRRGLSTLQEQVALGEIYRAWRAPAREHPYIGSERL